MESYSVINQTATPHSNLQNSTVAWSWWPEVNTDSDDDELIKISQNGKKKKNQTKLRLKFTNVWHLQMWTSRPPNQRPGPCEGGLVRVYYLSYTEFKPCVKHKACRPNLAHHVIIWVFHVYGVMYASILVYIKVVLTTFICQKKNHIFPNQAEMKKPFVMKATWLLWQQSLQWSQVVTLHIIFSLHIINRSLQYL